MEGGQRVPSKRVTCEIGCEDGLRGLVDVRNVQVGTKVDSAKAGHDAVVEARVIPYRMGWPSAQNQPPPRPPTAGERMRGGGGWKKTFSCQQSLLGRPLGEMVDVGGVRRL